MASFWDKWASSCSALQQDFSNSPNLHMILLLCAPPTVLNKYKGTHAVCFWEKPGQMRVTEPGCPLNRDVLETPTYRGWPALYALVGVMLVYSLIVYGNKPRRLLQVAFWLHLLITTIISCLSTFSGWATQPDWSSLVWNSNSPSKIVWMWLLVDSGH
ncbi:hypothetical protein G6011_02804 [Alternaria panax]|uniref:Uncharacterized protein n=1 Tax=Alternaria panax TaxID=48097 RepID=A0AAD4FAA4_9PLEO|nr:hypothetical protein G6011_02804 [Alternaria panax]